MHFTFRPVRLSLEFAPSGTQSECGFLSNWEEAKKLQEDSYQNQIAWAVSMGILSYLEEGEE